VKVIPAAAIFTLVTPKLPPGTSQKNILANTLRGLFDADQIRKSRPVTSGCLLGLAFNT
jgi:hypothetical protein